MKKKITIAEARHFFEDDKVFATKTGFIFNQFGKYRPNITFVLEGSFELDGEGKLINPLRMTEDREVTDNMNLDFDGKAEILFGDFWRSQKGGACFRPKDPSKAKHVLVRVNWGGCFKHTRGRSPEYAKEAEALYFRRASSNGGGSGYDYWVLPVGYTRSYEGDKAYKIDTGLAKAYCKRISQQRATERAESETALKKKLASEEASLAAKANLLPRIKVAAESLKELRNTIGCETIEIIDGPYFKLSYRSFLYGEQAVREVEAYVEKQRQRAAEHEAEIFKRQQCWEEALRQVGFLREQADKLGLEIITEEAEEIVLRRDGVDLCSSTYPFELDFISEKMKEVKLEQEAERRAERRRQEAAEAKAAGLPSDVRVWKRVGGRTGCSKGFVIDTNGIDRQRDRLFNENSRRAERYDEGYEVWDQILPGEIVLRWSKQCTAAEHKFEIIHRPEIVTEAQLERIAEIQAEIAKEWDGLTGAASGKVSPSIGDGWLGMLM